MQIMQSMWNHVCIGTRAFIRNPSFGVSAVLTLGFGIGAGIFVFSIVHAVLLRPLPYSDPNQLVWVTQGVSSFTNEEFVLAPDFTVWRSEAESFSHMAAFSYNHRNLSGGGQPERILTAEVSTEFLPLLRVYPSLGRSFLAEEGRVDNDGVAILTHSLWVKRFDKSRTCIGQLITLDDRTFQVVGILPNNFRFPLPVDVEILIPLALNDSQATRESASKDGIVNVSAIARLKPNVSIRQAQAELSLIHQQIVQEYPRFEDGKKVVLEPLHEHMVANVRLTLLLLFGAVGLVWLLSCLNVGGLVLVRSVSRQVEIAIRIALGASRTRLLSQVLTENIVLTFFGFVVGLLFTVLGHRFLVVFIPKGILTANNFQIDAGVLGFAVVISLFTALIVSIATIQMSSHQSIANALTSGARSVTSSRGLRTILRAVSVGQLVLAFMILISAGLMLQSFWVLRYGDVGFRSDQILVLEMNLTPTKYRERVDLVSFFEGLEQRVSVLPGVDGVALCGSAPPITMNAWFRVFIEGRPVSPSDPAMVAINQPVSTDYFRVMGIPLSEGRFFSIRDHEQSTRVVIVNDAFAKRYLDGEQVLGTRIRLGGSRSRLLTIIGVVGELRNVGLGAEPEPEVYRPYRQFPWLHNLNLVLRTSSPAPVDLSRTIEREIWALDPEQPITQVETMNQRLTASVGQPRLTLLLLAGFGGAALILAMLGVYTVTSFTTLQRIREIGIHIALGAQKGQVIWMVVKDGLLLSSIGIVLGTAGALATTRLLSTLLFGVTPFNPSTYLVVAGLLAFIVTGASYFPARRVTNLDPMSNLRHE